MKQYSFKNTEGSVQNNIQHLVRLPISFYNRIIKIFFISVQLRAKEVRFVDSFVIFKYTIVYCRIMYVQMYIV